MVCGAAKILLRIRPVFSCGQWVKYLQDEVKNLIFQDRFGILLKMRLSGVAEQGHTFVYGKSRLEGNFR